MRQERRAFLAFLPPKRRLSLAVLQADAAAAMAANGELRARLAVLERTIWQADPAQTNTTIEEVCAATSAQGGWLTPADWHASATV